MTSTTQSKIIEELEHHLDQIRNDNIDIDTTLVEISQRTILQSPPKAEETARLIPKLTCLFEISQDITYLLDLTTTLLSPFSYSQINALAGSQIDYIRGLNPDLIPSFHHLLLAILHKATTTKVDAATVASNPEVVAALIKLWLKSPDAGVGDEAEKVIYGLLAVDAQHENVDQRLVWKRVFQDRDVYELFYSLCSDKNGHGQVGLAQSRLMNLLPRLCKLDWKYFLKSRIPEIESQYGLESGQGLLDFACLHMVDVEQDEVAEIFLHDFYTRLISDITEVGPLTTPHSSCSLDYLLSIKVHERFISSFISHQSLVGGIEYISAYTSAYPEHLMSSSEGTSILISLGENFIDSTRNGRVISRQDLRILHGLPRVALLPNSSNPDGLIRFLTTERPDNDILDTLATIFGGPDDIRTITHPQQQTHDVVDQRNRKEAQNARILYYLYITKYNPSFFANLVKHADTIALGDVALTAIGCIRRIINAEWSLASEDEDDEFGGLIPSTSRVPTPDTGAEAILSPPSLEYTLPYLIRPAKSFTHLVGGRGDSENIAYKVALAKQSTLKDLYSKVLELAKKKPGQGYEDIAQTLSKTISRGPWAKSGEVGSQVATMQL